VTTSDYFKERPEITALIPSETRRLIDVGCGTGLVGAAIKRAFPAIQVFGVEPSKQSAEQATRVLDDVWCGTADGLQDGRWPAPDCILFADSLEHMPDPLAVLIRFQRLLEAGGTAVLSIPNVLHHSASFGLLRGRWDYTDSGVLDRTHLRFFTRDTALELVRNAGLEPIDVRRVLTYPRGFSGTLLRLVTWPRRWLESRRGIRGSGFFLLDLCTIQYLILATKPGPAK
jgi:SAM-dependent methyltransferase